MTKQKKSIDQRLRDYERQYKKLASELTEIGYLWNGTVTRQMLTCGRDSCACRRDKKARHGPYEYWSTKVKGKTVSGRLSPEEADLYEEWINNRRRLVAIERQMIALSKKVAPLILKKRRARG